ncbi:MAG: NAD(P)/FAD-dependent oxidoreductase [Proteobacteria bacterium]|nr:NAD(P)/FAD-dependent oxidoreductase [Pseudomonadota bacterium]
MLRLNQLKLPLDHTEGELKEAIRARLHIDSADQFEFSIFKRSYDARKKSNILLIYQIDVKLCSKVEAAVLAGGHDESSIRPSPDTSYHFVTHAEADFPTAGQQRPIVIGFGPCGILAALVLAQMGLKPIVLERGQEVRQRTQDTWGFWRRRELNTESNVQYGEGGAGTFSDGKLYSQVKDKRHLGRKVLTEFVKAGAPEEILFVSKPHIGTFKLVKMVENMRVEITRLGGEIRFGQKVESIHREGDSEGQITGLTLANGEVIESRHIILAIGHSARDSFQMLLDKGVYIEPKPFSIGFRIEHPQSVIDKARFGQQAGHPILGAADYKLVHHCKSGRSVYSFCMCPGGTVVAASSEAGCVVTNGMSQYSRNERNANAAIVVGITPEEDFPQHVLAGIDLQRELETLAYKLGGENYNAPAQLVGDFLKNTPSTELQEVDPSYQPGITLGDLSKALPEFAIDAIREAIPAFDKQIKGFAMPTAILTGVETRTSSPVCIKRGRDLQNINTRGLYPAGEGAGYAGGILSAAIDGIKVAEALALDLLR